MSPDAVPLTDDQVLEQHFGTTPELFTLPSFERFVASLKLEHFRASELLIRTDRALNGFPPVRLWPNIVPGLIVLDWLRHDLERPVRITNAWRSTAYNLSRRVKGGERSQHQAFRALDFQVLDDSGDAEPSLQRAARDLLRGAREELFEVPGAVKWDGLEPVDVQAGRIPQKNLERWRGDGSGWRSRSRVFRFRGGIGSYQNFSHLDARGINSRWKGARLMSDEGN